MSADMLRRAAAAMRERAGYAPDGPWTAVADWLEQHATQHESNGRDECRWVHCEALAVAAAYLGEQP